MKAYIYLFVALLFVSSVSAIDQWRVSDCVSAGHPEDMCEKVHEIISDTTAWKNQQNNDIEELQNKEDRVGGGASLNQVESYIQRETIPYIRDNFVTKGEAYRIQMELDNAICGGDPHCVMMRVTWRTQIKQYARLGLYDSTCYPAGVWYDVVCIRQRWWS